jgi:hypothetical protein
MINKWYINTYFYNDYLEITQMAGMIVSIIKWYIQLVFNIEFFSAHWNRIRINHIMIQIIITIIITIIWNKNNKKNIIWIIQITWQIE